MSVTPQPIEQPTDPPAEPPSEPRTPGGVGQAYLLFAVVMCLLEIFGAVAQVFWSRTVNLVILETLLILLPAVVYIRRKRLPIAEAVGLRPISPATALVSVVLGVSGMGMSSEIMSLFAPYIGPYIGPPRTANSVYFMAPWEFAIGLLCASLLPAICEEIFFRGAIQGTLARLGPTKSILMTAFLFALFHLNPWNFLQPLFDGVVWGLLTLRTGSIVPAMIAHASTNATAYTLNYLFDHDPRIYFVRATLSPLFVVVFAVYLAKTRHQAASLGPLAFAPAGLSGRALAATVIGSVLFVGLARFDFIPSLLAWHVVTAREEGEIVGLHEGDHVLLLKEPLAEIGLAKGAIVAIESDDRSRLGKVERCDPNRVWLVGWPTGAPLNRSEISGRAVRIVNREPH